MLNGTGVPMDRNICVFCSSSSRIPLVYFEAADSLGRMIAGKKDTLVYGGTMLGLMGAIADSVRKNGGKVVGVVPEEMRDKKIAYEDADWLFVTKDMRERKATMQEQAAAFVAMPGGFGTLEEISEVMTLKQLGHHDKPVVFLNTNGFYDRLLGCFDQMFGEHFIKEEFRSLFFVAATPERVYDHIEGYQPKTFPNKIF